MAPLPSPGTGTGTGIEMHGFQASAGGGLAHTPTDTQAHTRSGAGPQLQPSAQQPPSRHVCGPACYTLLLQAPHSSSLYWALRTACIQPFLRTALHTGSHAAVAPHVLVPTLRRRLQLLGLIGLLLSPFTLLYALIRFASQQVGDAQAARDYVGPRKWTQYALRLFRDYDELPHAFARRMVPSYELASAFLASRSSPILETLAQPVLTVSATVFGLIALLALLNEAVVLNTLLQGRNLLWYAGIAGMAVTLARGMQSASPAARHAIGAGTAGAGGMKGLSLHGHRATRQDELLAELALCTHYAPPRWFTDETTRRGDEAHAAVGSLFRHRVVNWLMECLGCVTTPWAMLFVLPDRCGGMVEWMRGQSYSDGRVGPVCARSAVCPAQEALLDALSPVPTVGSRGRIKEKAGAGGREDAIMPAPIGGHMPRRRRPQARLDGGLVPTSTNGGAADDDNDHGDDAAFGGPSSAGAPGWSFDADKMACSRLSLAAEHGKSGSGLGIGLGLGLGLGRSVLDGGAWGGEEESEDEGEDEEAVDVANGLPFGFGGDGNEDEDALAIQMTQSLLAHSSRQRTTGRPRLRIPQAAQAYMQLRHVLLRGRMDAHLRYARMQELLADVASAPFMGSTMQ